jgi:hypothetical protein
MTVAHYRRLFQKTNDLDEGKALFLTDSRATAQFSMRNAVAYAVTVVESSFVEHPDGPLRAARRVTDDGNGVITAREARDLYAHRPLHAWLGWLRGQDVDGVAGRRGGARPCAALRRARVQCLARHGDWARVQVWQKDSLIGSVNSRTCSPSSPRTCSTAAPSGVPRYSASQ